MYDKNRYPLTVGILLFDEVEVLDFCGPFEVFSVTCKDEEKLFEVITVAENRTITARNGLRVKPTHTLDSAPEFDIFLTPGGLGTRKEIHNTSLVEWIRRRAERSDLVLSVCTGALLLAKAGLLTNLKATTHRAGIDLLRELSPSTEILQGERFVDNGKFVLSAGISAGIDMSFHIVSRLVGTDIALQTARYMEYEWEPGRDGKGNIHY
jgi:transcriptional regulator GlxA family with amidase domain